MTSEEGKKLLNQFKIGKVNLETVLRRFQRSPFTDHDVATVDTHRALRKGFPEVIFGSGKTAQQVVQVATTLHKASQPVLVTRVSPDQIKAFKTKFPKATVHESARCMTLTKKKVPKRPGTIAVVSAGTSDMPVVEEAAVTADFMGNSVDRIYDVGVAGLHRLLGKIEIIQKAKVIIVVAGMEGALPSVVAGLVSRPVIAVPTSIGYGASFGGVAALLGMLTSCGSGVTVVNIDNGFGAGYAASQMNALANGEL